MVSSILLLLLLLGVPATVCAQSVAELRYTWFGATEIASRVRGDTVIASERTALSQVEARAGVPIVLPNRRGVLLPAASYYGLFPDSEPALATSSAFHEVGIRLLGQLRISDRWSVVVELNPGIAGDFTRLSDDDLLLRGTLLPVFDVSDSTTLGLGLALSTLLGTEQFIPVLLANIDPPGAFYMRASLPASLEVGAALGLIDTGARLRVQGTVFNLSQTTLEDDVLRASFGSATGFAAMNLRGPLWLDLDVGITFLRRVSVEQRDTVVAGLDRTAGPVISAGLRITP